MLKLKDLETFLFGNILGFMLANATLPLIACFIIKFIEHEPLIMS